MPDLASEPVDETLDATALLSASPVGAAVGPLTNVADALAGPHRIEQLVIMGGDITSGKPEHNISCDVAAAPNSPHDPIAPLLQRERGKEY